MAWAVNFVMSNVVHFLVVGLNYTTVNDGLWLGLLLFFGFALPLTVVQNAFNPRGNNLLVLVDSSYHLLFLLFQGAFIAYCAAQANVATSVVDDATPPSAEKTEV